eukprot:gene486-266_t
MELGFPQWVAELEATVEDDQERRIVAVSPPYPQNRIAKRMLIWRLAQQYFPQELEFYKRLKRGDSADPTADDTVERQNKWYKPNEGIGFMDQLFKLMERDHNSMLPFSWTLKGMSKAPRRGDDEDGEGDDNIIAGECTYLGDGETPERLLQPLNVQYEAAVLGNHGDLLIADYRGKRILTNDVSSSFGRREESAVEVLMTALKTASHHLCKADSEAMWTEFETHEPPPVPSSRELCLHLFYALWGNRQYSNVLASVVGGGAEEKLEDGRKPKGTAAGSNSSAPGVIVAAHAQQSEPLVDVHAVKVGDQWVATVILPASGSLPIARAYGSTKKKSVKDALTLATRQCFPNILHYWMKNLPSASELAKEILTEPVVSELPEAIVGDVRRQLKAEKRVQHPFQLLLTYLHRQFVGTKQIRVERSKAAGNEHQCRLYLQPKKLVAQKGMTQLVGYGAALSHEEAFHKASCMALENLFDEKNGQARMRSPRFHTANEMVFYLSPLENASSYFFVANQKKYVAAHSRCVTFVRLHRSLGANSVYSIINPLLLIYFACLVAPETSWVTHSAAMAMAAAMRKHFHVHAEYRYPSVSGSRGNSTPNRNETSEEFNSQGSTMVFQRSGMKLSDSRNDLSFSWLGETNKGDVLPRHAPEAASQASPLLSAGIRQLSEAPTASNVLDLLHNPFVQQLIRSSRINAIASGEVRFMTMSNCTAALALMAIAVECKNLVTDINKGFLTECSALYTSMVSKLSTLEFAEGIDIEEFCASLVACGLQLRTEEDDTFMGPSTTLGSACSSGAFRGGTSSPSMIAMKSVALSGFGHRAVDRCLLCCIPSDIDLCVGNVVAKGVLRGLCFTRSRRTVVWGPDLVQHIQDLTDLFAESPRREHGHKKVLMLLLEAMSCSRSISLERTSRWIAAILQDSYIVSGILQKNMLHSRVVAATLSLLVRHYQETTVQMTISKLPESHHYLAVPDFSEGDHLIDTVWKALQTAMDRDFDRSEPTVYGSNLQVVLFHVLYAELERLHSILAINKKKTMEGPGSPSSPGFNSALASSPLLPHQDSTDTTSKKLAPTSTLGLPARPIFSQLPGTTEHLPTGEEEAVRIRAVSHIIKFIMSPSSIFSVLPKTGKGSALRQNICRSLARVLGIITAGAEGPALTESGGTAAHALPASLSPAHRVSNFSNQYYRNMEGMAQILMNRMISEFGGSENAWINEASIATFIMDCSVTAGAVTQTNPSEIPKNSAAAICLIGLCGTDPSIRTFVVSALLDFGSKVCSTVNVLVENSAKFFPIASVNILFDTICRVLVPNSTGEKAGKFFSRCGSTENVVRCAQLILTSYANLLKQQLQLKGTNLASLVKNEELPTMGMSGSSSVFAALVNMVLFRMSELMKNYRESNEKRWREATDETIRIAKILLQEAQKCVLSVAWPGSGILFQPSAKSEHISPRTLSIAAARSIAPFLKPVAILLHLIPYTAVPSPAELGFRVDKCMRMILEQGDEESRYMCYFANHFESETPEESSNCLFRSCWLMLSYYGMTADAVSLARPKLIKDVSGTKLRSALTLEEVRMVVIWGSSSRTLLRMRSADLQQVEEDIKVILPRLKDIVGASSMSKRKMKEFLSQDILRVRPQCKRNLRKLSVSEVFLLKAIMELELVHSAAGSFAPMTTYHHFDVREFVASPVMPKLLQEITEYSCNQFIASTKNNSIPDLAFQLLRQNTRQLLLYATFAVRSVRECAVYFLRQLLHAFPMQIVQSGVLPLLWRLIDVVDVANPAEIARFCEKVRYLGSPSLPTEYNSTERAAQLMSLQNLSDHWVATARQRAPIDLLHVATHFVTSGYADGVSIESMHTGTRLAIMAGQIKAFSIKKQEEKGTSSVVIKFCRAKGAIIAALVYATPTAVEDRIVRTLSNLVQEGRRMLRVQAEGKLHLTNARDSRVTINDLPESFLAQLENQLYAASVVLDTTPRRLETQGLLILYLVQSPIKLFSPKAIKIAAECWSWLIISHRETLLIPILRNIVEGIQWTFTERLGLFDGEQTKQMDVIETGEGTDIQHRTESNRETAHHMLFKFVVENYLRHDSAMSQNSAVLSLGYILASLIVQHSSRLSLKDESFAETIQAMILVGKVVHQLFIANIRHLRANRAVTIPFTSIGSLRQRWYKALLHWFRKSPPSWYFAGDPSAAPQAIALLESLLLILHTERKSLYQNSVAFIDFSPNLALPGKNIGHLSSCRRRELTQMKISQELMTKLCSAEQARLGNLLQLIILLVDHELLRIRVWQQPRRTLNLANSMQQYKNSCVAALRSAVTHDPVVAVAMIKRLSGCFPQLAEELTSSVVRSPEVFFNIPEATNFYLTSEVIRKGAPKLYFFANAGIIDSLRLLDSQYSSNATVASYAIRSLLSKNSDHLIFYLPQLLQVLGSDTSGRIHNFLENMSQGSTMFCHQLLWSLRTEGEGNNNLAKKCMNLESTIVGHFSPSQKEFYQHEFDFIDSVISVSGELMKYEKPDRKPNLRRRLKDDIFNIPTKQHHLYLPTNPGFRVTNVIPQTASAMQSAAKCPIFVQFECVERQLEETAKPDELPVVKAPLKKACIFKMGDDCRQDQIALQLIELFRRIFKSIGVPSFLYPYRVVTTGQTSGIIECVPNSLSRNEIGKLVESNLAEYFVQSFGHPETSTFRRARENFVKSAAAYSIVTFVLNIKDRHNGNIMVDASGNLVHIDFGFLFDTSPGGDMNFESSPFKLTTEMIQLIGRDVGRSSTLKSPALQKALIDEDNYISFKILANRCYLAVRQYSREICILVELMLRSELPCFKPQQTIENLAKRLSMDENEITAAHFMRKRIHESKQNMRTKLYDHFQRIVEGIEM